MKNFTLITLLLSFISLTSWSQCNFDYTYSIDTANNQITFNNISTTSTSGSIYMYPDALNSNPSGYTIDNNFTSGNTAIANYIDGDTYVDVCMFAFNSATGCSDTICKSIYLPNACGFTLDLSIVDNLDGTITYTNTNNNAILFETGTINIQENSYYILAGQSITHPYNTNGTFPYLVTVNDSSTLNCYDTNYREVTVNSNCTADANFNASSFNNDLNYSFYALDSSNNCTYFWDFGDGASDTTWAQNHTYNAAGTYTVCLTVGTCGSNPCYDTICQTITVIDSNSTGCNADASFTFNEAIITIPLTYDFYALDSSNNCTYFWDFGDGATSTTWAQNHTYNAPGTYTVCLTVGTCGINPCYDTICETITVGVDSCNTNASFDWYQAYDSTNGAWTNTIYIIDQSLGNNLNYAWNFGDGNYAYDENPTHTYNNPTSSFFYVCLDLTTPDSCDASYCDSIIPQGNFNNYTIVALSGYTKIEEIKNSTFEVGNIYPNPTSDNSFITISSVDYSEVKISIVDLSGKLITQDISTLSIGENVINLNTNNLSNGMYLISITNEEGFNTNTRLIKK